MRRFLLVLPLCVSVLGFAACGGASRGLTKAQYEAKVSRLCLVAADQMRELHMSNSVGDWQHDGPTLVNIADHFDTELAGLKAPPEIATDAAFYLKASEKLHDHLKVAVLIAKAGYNGLLHVAINRANKDSLVSQASAKAIGATGCYVG